MSKLPLMWSGSVRFVTSSSGIPLNRSCFFRSFTGRSSIGFLLIQRKFHQSCYKHIKSKAYPFSSLSFFFLPRFFGVSFIIGLIPAWPTFGELRLPLFMMWEFMCCGCICCWWFIWFMWCPCMLCWWCGGMWSLNCIIDEFPVGVCIWGGIGDDEAE